MKKIKRRDLFQKGASIIGYLILMSCTLVSYGQGDYILQTKDKVVVSWRLVSDFQRIDAQCWGWTYHIFISNGNNYPITLVNNNVYQNNGDNTQCWQSGSIDLTGQLIPAGKVREFTFRVSSEKNGKPGAPGLKYNINWTSNYKEIMID